MARMLEMHLWGRIGGQGRRRDRVRGPVDLHGVLDCRARLTASQVQVIKTKDVATLFGAGAIRLLCMMLGGEVLRFIKKPRNKLDRTYEPQLAAGPMVFLQHW